MFLQKFTYIVSIGKLRLTYIVFKLEGLRDKTFSETCWHHAYSHFCTSCTQLLTIKV